MRGWARALAVVLVLVVLAGVLAGGAAAQSPERVFWVFLPCVISDTGFRESWAP